MSERAETPGVRLRGPDAAAEILKLAHQLGVPPSHLAFLGEVPTADLRALRGRIGDVLFAAGQRHFSKVVVVSKLLPAPLAARITEHVLSPLIAARTAELLEPDRAIDMVGRLSDAYLADVSAAMDPLRAPHVVARIPAPRVAAVAAELAARGEWVVMGGFVSVVSTEALEAAIAVLDGAQLLRIGYVLDDLARLSEIAALLTDGQLDEVLRAAAEHELWRELEELVSNVDGTQGDRVAARFAAADPALVAVLDEAARTGRLGVVTRTRLGGR